MKIFQELQELDKEELKKLNGGGWIYDLFVAIGGGAVITTRKSVDPERMTPMWIDKF